MNPYQLSAFREHVLGDNEPVVLLVVGLFYAALIAFIGVREFRASRR